MTEKKQIDAAYLLRKIEKEVKLRSGMLKLPRLASAAGVPYKVRRCQGRIAMFDCDDLEINLGKEPSGDYWQLRNFVHEILEATFEESMCRFHNANKEVYFFCNHDQFTAICSSLAKVMLDVIELNKQKIIHTQKKPDTEAQNSNGVENERGKSGGFKS